MCALDAKESGRGEFSPVIKDTATISNGDLVGVDVGGDDGRVERWDDTNASPTILFAGVAKVTGGDPQNPSQDALDDLVGNTAGTVRVVVDDSGLRFNEVPVTGAATLANEYDLVFGTDHETLTLTPTAGGQAIGYVKKYHTGTTCDVQLFSGPEVRALEAR